MRTLFCLSLMAVAGVGQSSYARGEEPKVVVEKAVLAHGGQERLAGLKAIRLKATGTVNLGAEAPFIWHFTWQSPKQLKIAAELEVAGQKVSFVEGFDGVSAWGSANGAAVGVEGKKLADAVIFVVSGGWVSDNQPLNGALLGPFVSEPVKRGYTVFAVFHGSQPKFTIPEAVADLHRAVRFIRANASQYGIDPNRIGITGGSAGGHLSLMQGTAGDLGDAKSSDPVEHQSSRVQAVACLFPPTDFLNYGGQGKYAFGSGELLMAFRPAVDVRELDPKTLRLERTTDERKQLELAAKISPITHVSADDPPTLIVHGDADKLVPIQQAEAIVTKFKQVGVRAELITRPKRGHDLNGIDKDVAAMTDWFDKHLAR